MKSRVWLINHVRARTYTALKPRPYRPHRYRCRHMSSSWGTRFAQVVLFGSSTTQFSFSVAEGGWGALVADHFQRRVDFLNRGFSGYNTEWAKLVLPTLFPSGARYDVVVVYLGANDSSLREEKYVPLDKYKLNLNDICNFFNSRAVDDSSLVLITPNPVCETMWVTTCHEMGFQGAGDNVSSRSNVVTEKYAKVVSEVALERGISFVNQFEALSNEKPKDCVCDGIHLNSVSNKALAERLIPILEEKLQSHAPNVFPLWDQVDASNLQHSFDVTQSK